MSILRLHLLCQNPRPTANKSHIIGFERPKKKKKNLTQWLNQKTNTHPVYYNIYHNPPSSVNLIIHYNVVARDHESTIFLISVHALID